VKKLDVYYYGWGQRWPLGTLADVGSDLLFEYSVEALRAGLELSPLHLKLREAAYGSFPSYLQHLPGLIADSLPDGWGLLLMDRYFRSQGVDPGQVSALDRLSFLGDRTMGALTYEPAQSLALARTAVDLSLLAREMRSVLAGDNIATLRQLVLLGGATHGTQPKVLAHYDMKGNIVSARAMRGYAPWIFKFPAQGEHKEVCALEALYADLARICGLDVPDSRHFDLGDGLAAYGAARFDMEGGMRVPVHTLAGALHADFRQPSSVNYAAYLRATRLFTRDEREVQKAYERMVFNVLFNNRDDHCKNFSFRLGPDLLWRLAPCHGLTFSEGLGGEHQMDVQGERREITRANMLDLAIETGVDYRLAKQAIDRLSKFAGWFQALSAHREIRSETVEAAAAAIESNRVRLQE
jgi:serine/threonine-protein kinase HipA